MEYKRVNNDVYGNPRYVFHFLDMPFAEKFLAELRKSGNNILNQSGSANLSINRNGKSYRRKIHFKTYIDYTYQYAIFVCSALLGGRKYNGKDFGGGIVFQSYNIQDTIKHIEEIQKQPA